MIEVYCPSCRKLLSSQKARPGGTFSVTCPRCKTKFLHKSVECSTIAMRCAKDGRPFNVTFNKNADSGRFEIAGITLSSSTGGASSPAAISLANAGNYDWRNVYCPSCGFSADPGESFGVKCGQCHELVCMGVSYDKLDETNKAIKWVTCYPECGSQGPAFGRVEEYAQIQSAAVEKPSAKSLPSSATSSPLRLR